MNSPEKSPAEPSESSVSNQGWRIVLANMGWLIFQRGALILLGIVATAWVSRYLQAEQLGMLSGATALVTYFGFLASGVDTGVMAKAILHEPEREGAIMGDVMAFLAFLGVISWGLLLVYVLIFEGLGTPMSILILILGTRLLLTFPAPLAVWLYSREKLKYTVLANTLSSTLLRVYQLLAVMIRGNIFLIAWAEFISLLANAGYCYWAYKRVGGTFKNWSFRLSVGYEIWKKSLPALISSSLFLLLLKLDILMLSRFKDATEAGYFSAASALSESLYFLTNLLALPLGPRVIMAFKQDREKYKRLQYVYFKVSSLLGWGCALGVSVGSVWIVEIVYGAKYELSAPILQVHAFMLLACFMGAAHGVFMTAESKLKYMAFNLGVGLMANFVVNLLLIPNYGAVGSAFATVIGVAVAYLLMPCVWRETRHFGLLALRSLMFPVLSWKLLRSSL